MCGTWIWGPTGTGKSHAVFTEFPEVYLKDHSKWWDGYNGEEVVFIDDLGPSATAWISHFLKHWGDKWVFPSQSKGSMSCLRPKKIVITSNFSIEQMGFGEGDYPAISRRFNQIFKENKEQIINF